MNMTFVAAVAVGGALGSLARYGLVRLSVQWLGGGYPWGTLLVNIVGSLALGVVVEVMGRYWPDARAMQLFLGMGFLGAFTTFSTFSYDFAIMYERGAFMPLGLYVAASVGLGVAAFFIGAALGRMA